MAARVATRGSLSGVVCAPGRGRSNPEGSIVVGRRARIVSAISAFVLASVGVLPSLAAAAQSTAAAPGLRAGNTRDARPAEPVVRVPLTDARGRRTLIADEERGAGDAVLTPPMATSEFYVAGVTWAAGGDLPDGARVLLRVLEDGAWSAWLEAGIEDGGPDDASAVRGTAPFVTGGAQAVQVQVTGDPAALPADLELALIPANPSAAEVTLTEPPAQPDVLPDDGGAGSAGAAVSAPSVAGPVGGGARGSSVPLGLAQALAAGTAEAALAGPLPASVPVPGVGDIVTRSDWGADETWTDANWTPRYFPLQAAVVHHTAGTNGYTAAESAGIVKAIFAYHTASLGWGDIGYNFLVDRFGTVFEGRKYSVSNQTGVPAGWLIEAGHATSFNKGSVGIAAMGDFTRSDAPDPAQIVSAMAAVIAWKFGAANLDSTSSSGFASPATKSTTTYPTGTALPRIFAHDDVAATLCPGTLYDSLSGLRTAVRASYTRSSDVTAPVVTSNPTGGSYPSGERVTLTANDPDAAIYYTSDGAKVFYSPSWATNPLIPNTTYTEPLTLTATTTLTYVAIDQAGNTSAPVTQPYTVKPVPVISGLAPSSGGVGTSVTITGANFTGATAVTFAGVTTQTFTVLSATSIVASVPSGAGTGQIAVVTPGGTAASTATFTVGATAVAPSITSLSPTSGTAGTTVMLTGTNVAGATSVIFSGSTLASWTVLSATQLRVVIPAGVPSGRFTVTTVGGSGTSTGSFTVSAPRIKSFTPTSGRVGTAVTITGANLTGATAVRFNGTTATFTVVSATSIKAVVPPGATTGKVTVSTGGGTATSSGTFTVK